MGMNLKTPGGFAGNLVRDPELKTLDSGSVVCNFTVAVNESYKSKGEKVEKVDFFNCVAWGKTGEFVEKFFKKGSNIFIQYVPYTEDWTDKEGNKRNTTKFRVSNATFTGAGGKQKDEEAPSTPDVAPTTSNDEEIPF